MSTESRRFQAAIERFDAANAEDPNRDTDGERQHPKELLYARRMSAWLERLEPAAPEAVRLAARCQHIRRWTVPRGDYPMDRIGYLRWRTDLKKFHAETAGEILRSVGYGEAMVARVQALLRKEHLKRDPDAQLLEDVVCVVFLAHYLVGFASGHEDDKVVDILRKTWGKMSPRGQAVAAALELPAAAHALVSRALAPETPGATS